MHSFIRLWVQVKSARLQSFITLGICGRVRLQADRMVTTGQSLPGMLAPVAFAAAERYTHAWNQQPGQPLFRTNAQHHLIEALKISSTLHQGPCVWGAKERARKCDQRRAWQQAPSALGWRAATGGATHARAAHAQAVHAQPATHMREHWPRREMGRYKGA
jgi:hypothetical protein